jgi:hypothetical protein
LIIIDEAGRINLHDIVDYDWILKYKIISSKFSFILHENKTPLISLNIKHIGSFFV